MLTLYSMQNSGNCYKVRWMLSLTGTPFEIVDIDIFKGESRTPEFLALNPNGKVPYLDLGDGRGLSESNAMLVYFAEGTRYLPQDPYERAQALQWMFFEQYSHEPYIAVARFWLSLVRGGRDLKAHLIDDWMERGYQALDVMERHLAVHDYFAKDQFTVADIALYAYTHVAHEGEFDLSSHPNVRAWLERVAAEPGHVAMDWRPPAKVSAL
jgi:glutathione S-transferase